MKSLLGKTILVTSISAFIFFFLWSFRPFGLYPHFTIPAVHVSFGYAIITFVITGAYVFALQDTMSRRYGQRWTIGKHLIAIFTSISLIGICNGIFAQNILNENYLASNDLLGIYLMQFAYTHAVGLFPVIIVLFVTEIRERNYYEGQSEQIKKKDGTYVLNQAISHAPIEIHGESTSEKLTLSSDDFLFARASGNYVDVFYQNDGKVEKEVMRITLSGLMKQMKDESKWIFQTHRSYLVNLIAVTKVEGNAQGYTLSLQETDEKVPVSRGKIQIFNEVMNDI